MNFDLEKYDFSLPIERIALSPNRGNSKLLYIKSSGFSEQKIKDYNFRDIVDLLSSDDVLIINETKVIKAYLFAHYSRAGKKIGQVNINLIQLIKSSNSCFIYDCAIKKSKKLKIADQFIFFNTESKEQAKYIGEIIAKEGKFVRIKFHNPNKEVNNDLNWFYHDFLDNYGLMPLPPYINKLREANETDDQNYQSLFANSPGSVAAPTASLHFDEDILVKLKEKKIEIIKVILHIGAGTFFPLSEENFINNKLHKEYIYLSKENADRINNAKNNNKNIVAVGTTALRVIESAFKDGSICEFDGETDIFIKEGFKFNVANKLITNFHLPKSSLLMLVCAFAGHKNIMDAYEYAVKNQYNFFSYGDACFIDCA